MSKKVLLLIISAFLLFGCSPKEKEKPDDEYINEDVYIDPLSDIFIFGELDAISQRRLKLANNNKEYQNYQFKMLYKDVFSRTLETLDGEKLSLSDYDRLIIEVVSVECSHCRKQLQLISDFVERSDALFIQYFNVGDQESITKMYQEEGVEIPDDLKIVSHDDRLDDYIRYELGVKSYPTLLCFNEGRLLLDVSGEIDLNNYAEVLSLSFTDPLAEEMLKEKIALNRDVEDVKNDLSSDNREKIEALDNDDYTQELTYQLIGKKLDYSVEAISDENLFVDEVEDFDFYKDKKVVLIYTYLRDNSETEKVSYINSLLDHQAEVEYLVVLVEGMESSSTAYKNMNIRFDCPAVSQLASVPEDLYAFGLVNYPTAVFVDRGVFCGAYSNIKGPQEFKEALKVFLSEESVALKANN